MAHLPFSVFKRKDRKFFYVQFKNKNGDYLPAVSTKQTSEPAAIEIAFKWYREGKPTNDGGSIVISLKDTVRNVKTTEEAEFVCKELKRQGFLRTYVISESKQAEDFCGFLRGFWEYDSSPYVREKLRKKHSIHRNYTQDQKLAVDKYWLPFFRGKFLGEITRQDIERFIDDLSIKSLSAGRINTVIRAGTIPLKWAYSKEMIDRNIVSNITWFSGKAPERQILSPEIAQAIFSIEWPDKRCRLANMLAAVTGLRAGEIQGLRVQDLGKECLYVRHSWNLRDKLKTTKNNEVRTVEVSFPALINELLALASENPHGATMDSYVFWSRRLASRPMDAIPFLTGLRSALIQIGMSKTTAANYVFHGWRHFFTSYMMDKLTDKLLQSQTGHKSLSMLKHYGEHELVGEREKIRQVQMEVFGALVPGQASSILIGRE